MILLSFFLCVCLGWGGGRCCFAVAVEFSCGGGGGVNGFAFCVYRISYRAAHFWCVDRLSYRY